MTRGRKIFVIVSLLTLSVFKISAQPVWVTGTPAVTSAGPISINLNYGIDREGTVYIIVFNYNYTSTLTSSYVRTHAMLRPSGSIVETAVLSVKKNNIKRILQTILDVRDPNQIHTIYIVAANNKAVLQASPVRLTATTTPCPQTDAGSGGNECDLRFVLNGVRVFGTGTWTRVSGPSSAIFSPNINTPGATVTVSVYGTYIFRWTETNGVCSVYDEVTVNFYRQPSANAGNGGNSCDLYYALSAATPSVGTGIWTMTSGTGSAGFSPNANTHNATVTVSDYGKKVFTWTVTNGTCSSSSGVTVNFYETPVANAGRGGNNCGLETYLGAIPSTGTGSWTRVSGPGNVIFSPNSNIPNPKVTVTAFGNFVFRWTETNGICSSTSDVTVGFFEQGSANAGNGGNECDRDFNLNALPGTGTGTWTKVTGPGNAAFSPNANQYNARVTVTQYGDYNFAWTEVNNTCSSMDIINVAFHAPPSVSAGPDKAVCKGNGTQLLAEGSGSFVWSPSRGLNNPAIYNPVATPQNAELYTVTLTDRWGCRNSDQVTVDVREKPVADAGPDQDLDYLFETSLDAAPLNINESGEWSIILGSGDFADKNNNSTIIANLSIEKNSFLWSVTNGVCPVSSDTVDLVVHELVIPTLITPNMDGKNDYFIIKGLSSLRKTTLSIFNRWGSLVFKSDDYTNNWYGTDKYSNPLTEDTYFFILTPEKVKAINGYLVIKR